MSQLDLLANTGAPDDMEISDVTLLKLQDKHAALILCMNVSCLEDKQIFGPLGLEQAQFSRIKNGSMHFPPNLEDQLMDVCGNEIPLRYAALIRGKELVPLRSTLEEENADLRQEVADLKRDKQTILDFAKRLK